MSNVTKPIILNETGEQIVQKLSEIASSNKSFELLLDTKADKTSVSAPYNFKGSTTYDALPTSNNKVNDTYYCTDVKCKYTWNGSSWFQSSLSEIDYTDELSKLSEENKTTNKKMVVLENSVTPKNEIECVTITPTFTSGKMMKYDGTLINSDSHSLGVVSVEVGEEYLLTSFFGSNPHYILCDDNDSVIKYSPISQDFVFNRDFIKIPSKCTKLYVNTTTTYIGNTNRFDLCKVTRKQFDIPNIFVKIENLFNYADENNVDNTFYQCNTFSENTHEGLGTSHFIPVYEGDEIVFKRCVDWCEKQLCFALWNVQQKSSITHSTDFEYTFIDEIFRVKIKKNGYLTVTYKKSSKENFTVFKNISDYPSTVFPFGEYYFYGENVKTGVNEETQSDSILSNKKAIFIGDSICEGLNGGDIRGYAYVINENNPTMNCVNYGVGGACIGVYEGQTVTNVLTQIDNAHSVHNDSDYVIIEGGVNDGWSEGKITVGDLTTDITSFDDSQFAQALEHLFYKAMTYYPTAKIGFIICHISSSTISPYMEKAIEVCKKWKVPYLDMRYNLGVNPSIQSIQEMYFKGSATDDLVHPNGLGYINLYAPKIEAWLKTL